MTRGGRRRRRAEAVAVADRSRDNKYIRLSDSIWFLKEISSTGLQKVYQESSGRGSDCLRYSRRFLLMNRTRTVNVTRGDKRQIQDGRGRDGGEDLDERKTEKYEIFSTVSDDEKCDALTAISASSSLLPPTKPLLGMRLTTGEASWRDLVTKILNLNSGLTMSRILGVILSRRPATVNRLRALSDSEAAP